MFKTFFSPFKFISACIMVSFFLCTAHALEPVEKKTLTVEDLGLTVKEKRWLENNPTINVAGPKDFPPFYFLDTAGQVQGISANYLNRIVSTLDLNVNIHKNLAWSRVLEMAKAQKLDVIVCAAKTENRKKYLSFSEPYLSFPLVIVSRKEADFIRGIDDLNGKTLAVIKNTSTPEWLKRDNIQFIPHYVNRPIQGLEAVAFGKAQVRIENLAAASYLIQKNGLANLKIAAPTPYGNYHLYMAVSKSQPELLSIINKSLLAISSAEQSRIINKWLSVRYEHGIKYSDIYKWLIPTFLFSTIIVIMVLVWNRSLKKESTERKQAEEQLRVSERKYRHLYNNVKAAMYEVNFVKNRFTSVNEVMCDYAGYSEDEFLNMDPLKLLTPESQVRFIKRMETIESQKEYNEYVEYDVVKKDGSLMCVVLSGDYFFEKDQLVSARMVVHDITPLKKVEKEKIKAQKIAGEHEKMALVGQIAGKMAHDFNNILGIIMGNAELSIIDCKDKETRAALELIFEQTLRGKNLTKNLVAFAKDQEPRQKFFKLAEKIDLVLVLLRKDLEGIEIIREDSPDIREILADPGMIEHAIVNLLQNAIHAVSLEKAPKIYLKTYCTQNHIYFEIEDNGCGIPAQYIDDIYEPSFSLKGSRDVCNAYQFDIKGTGYGMSNVKKYIEQHKGTIKIQSQVEEGTKFTITLPVIEKELTREEKQIISEENSYSGKRILLVEDETDISDVQYRILTQAPCNHMVDVAQDAAGAMALFDKNTYDFVSLDYVLTGKTTGIDIYKYIRKTNKKIPILFISGNFTFIESIKHLKQEDRRIDHLSKPCLNKDYISCINQLLAASNI